MRSNFLWNIIEYLKVKNKIILEIKKKKILMCSFQMKIF